MRLLQKLGWRGTTTAVAVACSAWLGLLRVNGENRQMKTTWIGHPMVSDNNPYTPSQGWLSNHEIGFREDGVVVWREVKPQKENHESQPEKQP